MTPEINRTRKLVDALVATDLDNGETVLIKTDLPLVSTDPAVRFRREIEEPACIEGDFWTLVALCCLSAAVGVLMALGAVWVMR